MDKGFDANRFEDALARALSAPPFDDLIAPDHLSRFIAQASRFASLLYEANKKTNLTAITSPEDMAVKHVVDSLTALLVDAWPAGARVCDVGTGGGLPGIIIGMARPDLHVTFVDSVAKKLRFVDEAARALGISAVSRHERAEILGRDTAHREAYDVVIARALARLSVAAELCLPLTAVGGWFVAMKGPDAREELDAAQRAIDTLGGARVTVKDVRLPADYGDRTLIAVYKEAPTPARYPRRPGTPARDPL